MNDKKNPPFGGSDDLEEAVGDSMENVPTKKRPGKLESMFRSFAEGKKYHRFTAEVAGDHALPSTISDLQKKHGVFFNRRRVKVKNRFGGRTSVSLYWLEAENLAKARRICGLDVGGA